MKNKIIRYVLVTVFFILTLFTDGLLAGLPGIFFNPARLSAAFCLALVFYTGSPLSIVFSLMSSFLWDRQTSSGGLFVVVMMMAVTAALIMRISFSDENSRLSPVLPPVTALSAHCLYSLIRFVISYFSLYNIDFYALLFRSVIPNSIYYAALTLLSYYLLTKFDRYGILIPESDSRALHNNGE